MLSIGTDIFLMQVDANLNACGVEVSYEVEKCAEKCVLYLFNMLIQVGFWKLVEGKEKHSKQSAAATAAADGCCCRFSFCTYSFQTQPKLVHGNMFLIMYLKSHVRLAIKHNILMSQIDLI